MKKNTGYFTWKIIFSFFCSSFSPLFLIIFVRQITANREYLHFAGFTRESIYCFFSNFFLGFFLLILGIIGIWGTVKTLNVNSNNGESRGKIYTILSAENKNKDSVAYIATYLISFIFQNFDKFSDALIFLLILTIIFFLYAKTNLFMYNPLLLPWYSIYSIECEREENGNKEIISAEIIIKEEININSNVRLYRIGNDIFYGTKE